MARHKRRMEWFSDFKLKCHIPFPLSGWYVAFQIGFPCLVACSGYLSVLFLYLEADLQAVVVACEGRKGLQCGVVGGR